LKVVPNFGSCKKLSEQLRRHSVAFTRFHQLEHDIHLVDEVTSLAYLASMIQSVLTTPSIHQQKASHIGQLCHPTVSMGIHPWETFIGISGSLRACWKIWNAWLKDGNVPWRPSKQCYWCAVWSFVSDVTVFHWYSWCSISVASS